MHLCIHNLNENSFNFREMNSGKFQFGQNKRLIPTMSSTRAPSMSPRRFYVLSAPGEAPVLSGVASITGAAPAPGRATVICGVAPAPDEVPVPRGEAPVLSGVAPVPGAAAVPGRAPVRRCRKHN